MVTKRTDKPTSRGTWAAAATDAVAPTDCEADGAAPSAVAKATTVQVEMVDPASLLVDVNVPSPQTITVGVEGGNGRWACYLGIACRHIRAQSHYESPTLDP